ncbi:MAG TPA: MBL fold metallo-hydrolase [Limnochordia bacterium]|nr:MBL fold metallo-hydrolase [Limnochordia bacterium]
MKKRIAFLVLALVLILSWGAWAEEQLGRYDLIFDASQDGGRLTARFLQLTTRSEDKSGDCTILTSPDGRVMVIDAGNPSTFPDVDGALQALGITRIDYLVASHPHVDHIGSFAQLIYNYEIGAVYTSELEYPTSHYRNYMEAIERTKVPHIILAEGDSFMFGQHVRVEVLHPPAGIEYYEGYPLGSTQFINNRSLVLKLTFKDSTFLFTGDVYTAAEREIVGRYGEQLKADVLKVPHHGDSTSSSKAFREAVSPQIAVMMHDAIADLRIYRNYSRAGASTYITSIDGSVLVSTAGDGQYTVITQFDRKTDFLD